MERKGLIELLETLSIAFGLIIFIFSLPALFYFSSSVTFWDRFRIRDLLIFLFGPSGVVFGILHMQLKGRAKKIFLLLTVIWLFIGLPLMIYYYLLLGIK
jgi:hypothetical protein